MFEGLVILAERAPVAGCAGETSGRGALTLLIEGFVPSQAAVALWRAGVRLAREKAKRGSE